MTATATTTAPNTTPPKDAAAKPAGAGRPGGGAGRGGHPGAGRGGGRRRQRSRYGTQMEEKQNLKKIFGIREEQLRRYYREAHRHASETGLRLISLLELRLDNAVYRAGFAPTRRAARQMSSHRLFSVNGRPVTVPSLRLSVGDVVTVRESKRAGALFENFEKSLQNVAPPSWIVLQPEEFGFRVTDIPSADEAAVGVNVRAIVEFFAR